MPLAMRDLRHISSNEERGPVSMNHNFPKAFMHFTVQLTGVERAMAVAPDGTVLDAHGLTEAMINGETFTGFQNIQQAIDSGEAPHVTNNTILDPEAAPNTNTNFANLRVVVVFPLGDEGFVYVDQHVRHGVIEQDVLERLQQFADNWLAAGKTGISAEEMAAQYTPAE